MVERPDGQLIRLALCEDEASYRRFLGEALERLGGFEVIAAANVDELLAALEANPVDLVLVDLYQGRVPRFDAAGLVRSVAPDAKVMFLTYSSFTGDIRRALELDETAAVDGYLTKDADLAEIEMAIKIVVRGGRYLDPRIVDEALPKPDDLSPSEVAALQALADGLRLEELGDSLAQWSRTGSSLSARQVRRITASATEKLGAGTLIEAVSIAHRKRLIT